MKRKTLLACMVMVAGIIPSSSIMVANDNTPEEEKVIELTEQADITVRSGGALVLSNEGNLLLKTNDSMTAELGSTVTINPDCSICVEK